MAIAKNTEIIPPKEGWKENTYYYCMVSVSKNNSIHEAIFYSGFLNGKDKGPGAYSKVWNPIWEDPRSLEELYYLEVVKELQL